MGTVTSTGTANNAVTATSKAFTCGVTASVGDRVIVAISTTAGTSPSSATHADTAGNTWTRRGVANSTSALGNIVIFDTTVTSAISSGQTFTVSSMPSAARWAFIADVVTGISAFTDAGTQGASVGTTPSSANTIADANSMCFGYVQFSVETATVTDDSDTTNGSWSASTTSKSTGGGTTNAGLTRQYKNPNASGSQTHNPTLSTSSIWCAIALEWSNTSAAATPMHLFMSFFH